MFGRKDKFRGGDERDEFEETMDFDLLGRTQLKSRYFHVEFFITLSPRGLEFISIEEAEYKVPETRVDE